MNTIEHKGYPAVVGFEREGDNGVFTARAIGIRDLILAEGESAKELVKEYRAAIDEYLVDCKNLGREPQKPASGHFQVRIAPVLHARAKAIAEARAEKTSMNDIVTEALERMVGTP
ncbi:MAG: type II toxin-antitoxin system HicB family antitoxin [Verrucomicrobiales bacterium]